MLAADGSSQTVQDEARAQLALQTLRGEEAISPQLSPPPASGLITHADAGRFPPRIRYSRSGAGLRRTSAAHVTPVARGAATKGHPKVPVPFGIPIRMRQASTAGSRSPETSATGMTWV